MPTPMYTLRLPHETQTGLRSIARLFGAPNERAFVRNVLETVISHDRERVEWLLGLIRANVGEQTLLTLTASTEPPPLAVRRGVSKKRGKGGRKRGRRT